MRRCVTACALGCALIVSSPAIVAAQAEPNPAPLVAPKLSQRVDATYPPEALKAGLEADVVIELTIAVDGTVSDARVAESAGGGFDSAAIAAVKRFRFEPARRGTQPVAVRIRYRYAFRLPRRTDAAPKPAPAVPTKPAAPRPHATRPAAARAPTSTAAVPEYGAEARVQAPVRGTTKHTVDGEALLNMPGTGGDAMRTVEVLPGVGRPPVGDGTPILRGASPYESLVFVDGAPVPLLYHFGSLKSTFNSRLLRSVDLYPGNFSVRYGRAYGGVVSATSRDPKRDRFHALLEISVLDSMALVEAPIGASTGFAAAVRRSNIDFVFSSIVDEDDFQVVAAPLYWDYESIVTHRFDRHHQLKLVSFGSRDQLELLFDEPGEDPTIRGQLRGAIEFHRVQVALESRFRHVEQDVSLLVGRQFLTQEFGPEISGQFDAWDIVSRGEWRLHASPKLTLTAGFDFQGQLLDGDYKGARPPALEGDPGIDEANANSPQVKIARRIPRLNPALYAEVNWRPIDELSVVPGIRADYFGQIDRATVDPRLAVRLSTSATTTLKSGVGLFTQEPVYFHAIDGLGNASLKPPRALHVSVGVEQQLSDAVSVTAETYYKRLTNMVVATPRGASPFFINDGVGRIYGAELSAKIKPKSGHYAYASYSLSRSERRDRNAAYRLFDQDQTHNLSIAGGYPLGAGWQLGGRFRLVSGNPTTPVERSVFDASTGLYRPVFGTVNSGRSPTFHQLDIRIEKAWRFTAWQLTAYLDVQNVYNSQVQQGTSYSYDYAKNESVSGLPIFPNLGIRGEL